MVNSINICESIKELIDKVTSQIRESADIEAENLYKSIVDKEKIKVEKLLKEAKEKSKIDYEQKVNEYVLIEKQYVSKVERETLDILKKQAVDKLNGYIKDDLLNLVSSLIANDDVVGNEVIQVAEKDYTKFLKALSTKNASNTVDADLLNKKLQDKKYQFTLSSIPANISSGFILIGIDFDLNFDFILLIESIMDNFEKELSNELFN